MHTTATINHGPRIRIQRIGRAIRDLTHRLTDHNDPAYDRMLDDILVGRAPRGSESDVRRRPDWRAEANIELAITRTRAHLRTLIAEQDRRQKRRAFADQIEMLPPPDHQPPTTNHHEEDPERWDGLS